MVVVSILNSASSVSVTLLDVGLGVLSLLWVLDIEENKDMAAIFGENLS